MPQYRARDLDWVMLSIDEPSADENFQDLLAHVPWAKRSHGVLGFDAAHRAAADKATTDIFITVDADSRLLPHALEAVLDVKTEAPFALATSAQNAINGLCYGNGGLKFWSKQFVYSMNSHEKSDNERVGLDFCWCPGYFSRPEVVLCTTHPNCSDFHSWRAGFREGVKFMDTYQRLGNPRWASHHLFLTWCSVGADKPYGSAAMDGTIHGAISFLDKKIDPRRIADYATIRVLYSEFLELTAGDIARARARIASIYKIPVVPVLTPDQSEWFRETIALKNVITRLEV